MILSALGYPEHLESFFILLYACLCWSLTFSQTTILDSSKLKEFTDIDVEFAENGEEFCRRVENSVGNREIVHNEQFLLFPQCFLKTCTTDT